MSRWTPGKPIDQVMQVRMPFSGKDGHKVGNGRKAEKTLTAAVKEAEAARDDARAVLDEMRGLECRDVGACEARGLDGGGLRGGFRG